MTWFVVVVATLVVAAPVSIPLDVRLRAGFRVPAPIGHEAALIDDALADQLDRSLNLVVLCSPWATRSSLVDQVVRTYKMSGRSSRLLAAIIAGIPHATGEQAAQECFPAATRFNVDEHGELLTTPAEPIAADFRTADGGEGWTDPEAYLEALQEGGTAEDAATVLARAYEERLRLMKLKIVAGVLGVSLGCPVHRATRAYSPLESARKRAACAEASAWSVRSASR